LPAVRAVSKHHWLIIACDACDTVVDLELRVKREATRSA
jgi:transposase-like protein